MYSHCFRLYIFNSGYAKIGSLVALCHDMCDVPLDFFKLVALRGWRRVQVLALLVTIGMYLYWRVWYFCTQILTTIFFESKNMIDDVPCTPGDCTWFDVPERAPFLLCLLVLLGLNAVSIVRMVRVQYRLLTGTC